MLARENCTGSATIGAGEMSWIGFDVLTRSPPAVIVSRAFEMWCAADELHRGGWA